MGRVIEVAEKVAPKNSEFEINFSSSLFCYVDYLMATVVITRIYYWCKQIY